MSLELCVFRVFYETYDFGGVEGLRLFLFDYDANNMEG